MWVKTTRLVLGDFAKRALFGKRTHDQAFQTEKRDCMYDFLGMHRISYRFVLQVPDNAM